MGQAGTPISESSSVRQVTAEAITIAVVLAAGGGSRFTGSTHKLAAPLRGRTVAGWAVQAALDADIGPVIVVTGAIPAGDLSLPPEAIEVTNARWAEGQATSLQVAVAHARECRAEAIVVGVADQPLVPSEAWRRVAACSATPICTASFDGERRPPVRLSAGVWPLLPTSGDEGARVLLRQRPELVGAVACPGVPADIDTVEDLAREMELLNDFSVNVPIEEAWVTLTDVERIAPCLPGAQLEEIEGDVYRGKVKVKVGPILAQFKGQATFVEKDEKEHKAVLKAEGRETGGKGNASALITAHLQEEGPRSTKVTVKTDLTITGKVAQFGRGALADVSTKLLNQFVEQLETTVLSESPPPASGSADSASESASHPDAEEATGNGVQPVAPAKRIIDAPEAEPVDLVDAAGVPIAKRVLPVVGGLIVLFLVFRWLRRR